MTKLPERIASGEVEAPEVLVGGTPCQSFSVAGLREGLNDNRGELTLKFVQIANEKDEPEAIIWWENVPGVLSTKDNAFGCFLAALAGESSELQPTGKRWGNAGCVLGSERTIAWRVLDAQRRKRVFLIASAREGFDPSEILFEYEGVRRDTAPDREEGKEATPEVRTSTKSSGSYGEIVGALCARDFKGIGNQYVSEGKVILEEDLTKPETLVRRLTPVEYERLQGFPDNYTKIPWRNRPATDCPDGHRYKALGNSMAVPVMRWIAERIEAFRS